MKNLLWAVLIAAAVGVAVPGVLMMKEDGHRVGQVPFAYASTPTAPGANATAIAIPTAAAGAAAASTTGGSATPDGKALATSLGCAACHSTTGAAGVGPSWKGVVGSKVDLADGSSVTADDAFLKESIVSPNAKIVKGFAPGLMPATFATLPEAQITALIEYIKTLK